MSLCKFAGLKSTAMASDANSKQPKTAKISLKKDVNQVNSLVAPQPRMQFDDTHRVVKAKKRSVVRQSEAQNRVELFRHLPQYAHGTQLPDLESKFLQPDLMHPSVYKVIISY
jgi:translation initiation factor eIF-2B subunit delta